MPRVVVPIEQFEAGRFPAICARTGGTGDIDLVIEARYTPGWVYFMLLFGVLPFFVAAYFASQRRVGAVPVSIQVAGKLRAGQWTERGGWAAAIGLFVLAYATESGAALWAAGTAVVVAIGAWIYRWIVTVRLRMDEEAVVITNAHERFAAALRGGGAG
jgi:hypothetical protein